LGSAYFGAFSGPSDEHKIEENFSVKNFGKKLLLILVCLSEVSAWGCRHVRPMVNAVYEKVRSVASEEDFLFNC